MVGVGKDLNAWESDSASMVLILSMASAVGLSMVGVMRWVSSGGLVEGGSSNGLR